MYAIRLQRYKKTYIIQSKRNHSLKYPRSTTSGHKDIRIKKSEFVAKTKSLSEHHKNQVVISVWMSDHNSETTGLICHKF